ncbi:hypothetical protein [Paenibacillus amylolyticus]|uniref:hypothetical protein n=1 Tax=Paenibacillus amylolyticus TaxID=1451 RepID=UPI003395A8CD
MDEQRLREIIREELIAHDERVKGETVTIRVNDQMKVAMLEIMKNMIPGVTKTNGGEL